MLCSVRDRLLMPTCKLALGTPFLCWAHCCELASSCVHVPSLSSLSWSECDPSHVDYCMWHVLRVACRYVIPAAVMRNKLQTCFQCKVSSQCCAYGAAFPTVYNFFKFLLRHRNKHSTETPFWESTDCEYMGSNSLSMASALSLYLVCEPRSKTNFVPGYGGTCL